MLFIFSSRSLIINEIATNRMREGWEWDPITGEREPLREEMRKAVDEGRVGYDECGGLVILDGKREENADVS